MEENKKELEKNLYEEIIARYTDSQLLIEQVILAEQEKTLYAKKKAMAEEIKRRFRK